MGLWYIKRLFWCVSEIFYLPLKASSCDVLQGRLAHDGIFTEHAKTSIQQVSYGNNQSVRPSDVHHVEAGRVALQPSLRVLLLSRKATAICQLSHSHHLRPDVGEVHTRVYRGANHARSALYVAWRRNADAPHLVL